MEREDTAEARFSIATAASSLQPFRKDSCAAGKRPFRSNNEHNAIAAQFLRSISTQGAWRARRTENFLFTDQ
jgi:hypothetical protein